MPSGHADAADADDVVRVVVPGKPVRVPAFPGARPTAHRATTRIGHEWPSDAELVGLRVLDPPADLAEIWLRIAGSDYGPQFEARHFERDLLEADVFVDAPVTVPAHMHVVDVDFVFFRRETARQARVPDLELAFRPGSWPPAPGVTIPYWQRTDDAFEGSRLDYHRGPRGERVDPARAEREARDRRKRQDALERRAAEGDAESALDDIGPTSDDGLFHVKNEWRFIEGLCGAWNVGMTLPVRDTELETRRRRFWDASFKEFIERTWHPSRVARWCFAHDDLM